MLVLLKINIELTKTKSKKTQINKIGDERGIATMDSAKIQGTVGKYFKNLHSKKLKNQKEVNKF